MTDTNPGQRGVTRSLTEGDLTRLVAGYVEHWTRFKEDLPRFEAMQAAGRKSMLRTGLEALLHPWRAGEAWKEWGTRELEELNSLPSTATRWAEEEIAEVIGRSDDDSWALLMALVRGVPESLLDQVGAGPAEVFFDDFTADHFSAKIREALATEPRFRTVLESAWHLPDSIEALLAEGR